MIFVPLPRRVGPTAKPPFWRSRRSHPRTLLPDSACLAHAAAWPTIAAPLPTSRCAPTAGTGDGRSGRADTSPAAHATVLPCPAPTAHRSAPRACHATDDHDYPPAEHRARQARRSTTVHQSTPSVLPFGIRGIAQSNFRMHQFYVSEVYETGSSLGNREHIRIRFVQDILQQDFRRAQVALQYAQVDRLRREVVGFEIRVDLLL